MEPYEITVQDIKDYLASLQMQEVAGVVLDVDVCLVARALGKKYNNQRFSVITTSFSTSNPDDPWWEFPEEISDIISKFDNLGCRQDVITRSQVEEGIPALKGAN